MGMAAILLSDPCKKSKTPKVVNDSVLVFPNTEAHIHSPLSPLLPTMRSSEDSGSLTRKCSRSSNPQDGATLTLRVVKAQQRCSCERERSELKHRGSKVVNHSEHLKQAHISTQVLTGFCTGNMIDICSSYSHRW